MSFQFRQHSSIVPLPKKSSPDTLPLTFNQNILSKKKKLFKILHCEDGKTTTSLRKYMSNSNHKSADLASPITVLQLRMISAFITL
jgi:hypothetical protein